MKFILLIIVNLLLFNSCLSAITNETSVGSTNEILNKNGQHKISLMDLNDDVLFLIFKEMDLIEWLNMVKVHSVFVPFANDAYRSRYRGYQVKFDDDIYKRRKSRAARKPVFVNQPNIQESYTKPKFNRLLITDHQLALNVLKYFSSNIQELFINGRYSRPSEKLWKVVNQFVNRYASNFITKLKIYIMDNTLEQYTLPFNKVEILDGGINVNQIGNSVLALNKIFPKLQMIKLVLSETASFQIIDCEFPQLGDVSLSLFDDTISEENQKLIQGFVKKNSQIKSLSLFDSSWKNVEYFSQHLSNLVNLSLDSLNDVKSNKIEFKSVKNVKIFEENGKYATKLSFPQLENIHFRYSFHHRHEWTNFFRKHQTVKTLHLDEITYEHHGNNRGRNDLVILTESLSDLIEVEMSCDYPLHVQEFTQFIQSHPNLMRIAYNFRGFYRERSSEIRILREKFENQWNITQIGKDNIDFIELIFEKKNVALE